MVKEEWLQKNATEGNPKECLVYDVIQIGLFMFKFRVNQEGFYHDNDHLKDENNQVEKLGDKPLFETLIVHFG